MRGHTAGTGKCACPGRCAALGERASGPARAARTVRPRGQGHAHAHADAAGSAAGRGRLMLPRERLAAAIRAAAAPGEPALVAFLTAGFPRRAQFGEHLADIAAGADVVEIGVPFTDPMADGMTIQRSSHAALSQGVSLQWIFDELGAMQRPDKPLLLMSYLNPLLSYGFERLAAASVASGVCGFIVPDLPLDESDALPAALDPSGLALVQMVTPVTPPAPPAKPCPASHGLRHAA